MPNLRCSCSNFPETALDNPLFFLELASAESITVGIAPCSHSSKRRCSVLCSKQTKKMQLMTACTEFGFLTSLALGTEAETESSSPGQLSTALGTTVVVFQALPSVLLDCSVLSVVRQRCSKQQLPSCCDLDLLNVCSQSVLLQCVRLNSRLKNKLCEFIICIVAVCTDRSQCRFFALQGQMHQKGSHAFILIPVFCNSVVAILAHRSRGS